MFEDQKEFKWLGHFIFPGVSDGEYIFELIDNKYRTKTFIQREKFKGILVPLFKKIVDNNTIDGFKQMNKKLKE